MSATDGASLVELLRELTIAWKNRLAYPENHPACSAALLQAHRTIAQWTAERGPLLLGVAANGWVVDEGKLDAFGVQRIAEALYQRDVAVLGFEPGLEAEELSRFFALLPLDPRAGSAAPLWDELLAARVRHIYLEPVDYSRVELEAGAAEGEDGRRDLWDRILRELVAGRELVTEGADLEADERRGLDELSALLAEALEGEAENEGQGDGEGEGRGDGEGSETPGVGGDSASPAGDSGGSDRSTAVHGRRGAGARLADLMSRVFAESSGASSIATVRRLAAVVRALPESLRRALIDAVLRPLASDAQGGEALAAFTSGLPRQSALSSLERLAQERVALSARAAQLASELRRAGAEPAVPPTTESDRLFSELRELYGSADIDRLNSAIVPEIGQPLALEMPRPGALDRQQLPDLGERRDTLAEDYLYGQLAHALLEIAGRQRASEISRPLLRRLRALYREFLAAGRLQFACELVETIRALHADPTCSTASRLELEQTLERMAGRRAIAALLDGLQEIDGADMPRVQRLVGLLGPAAVRHLLAALGEEDDRSRRHRLMILLTALGPAIVGETTQLLADPRWFVVRNAIVLLRTIGDRSALDEITRCAGHGDLRVRLEAIKSLFVLESEVPVELLRRAILDSDPKLAEAAVALVGAYGITQASEPLVELLARRDLFGLRRGVRLKAIKALGNLHDPQVLPRLRYLFRGGWFGVARAERLAAYRALVCYPVETRTPWIQLGLRARDAEVRAICSGLEGVALASLEETRA